MAVGKHLTKSARGLNKYNLKGIRQATYVESYYKEFLLVIQTEYTEGKTFFKKKQTLNALLSLEEKTLLRQ